MKGRRIAVLGLFRSGSTAVAGVLHHLGVDMGAPFYGLYYESDWLSERLREWGGNPRLRADTMRPERVRILKEWVQKREQAGALWVGMKHPLLSLFGDDLVQAWGEETKFIRCCRPLDESVESMKNVMGRRGRGDVQFMQGTLMTSLDRFCAGRPHLEIHFGGMMNNPGCEIQRLVDFLQITPGGEDIATALEFIQPGQRAKVEKELKEQKARAGKSPPLTRLVKALRKAVRFAGFNNGPHRPVR
jgi:hypothetical protein